MARKSLFRDDDDRFTPEGIELDADIGDTLAPIFDMWYERGYSPREIAHIAMLAVQMEECSLVLRTPSLSRGSNYQYNTEKGGWSVKTCKSCGAVLSRSETKFEDIIGQEHAKRALEVALAGNHTIGFIGRGEAEVLAEWAVAHGLTAWAEQQCPCGYYSSDGHRECTCSLSQVSKWQKRKAFQNALSAEIVVECPAPYPHQIDAWVGGRCGEPESAILARVEDKSQVPDPALDPTSRSLVNTATKQLELDMNRVKSIIGVAQTIAALAHAEEIGVVHVAEAIQYRPRKYY